MLCGVADFHNVPTETQPFGCCSWHCWPGAALASLLLFANLRSCEVPPWDVLAMMGVHPEASTVPHGGWACRQF